MKLKFNFQESLSAIAYTLKRFPVEMFMALNAFVMGVFMIEDSILLCGENILLFPILIVIVYLLNCLFPTCVPCEMEAKEEAGDHISKGKSGESRFRWVYYLSGLLVVLLWVIDLSDWTSTWKYGVGLGLAFASFFVARQVRDNEKFLVDASAYIVNFLVSLLFTSIALGLIMAIYYSILYIFGINGSAFNFPEYMILFVYTIVAPLMFFSFVGRNMDYSIETSRFLDVLLNYIVTPALLAYTVVLYIYFLKIVFTWSLPKGNIALMVFGFTLMAVVVKACQPLLSRRYYDWFFDRFSIIALPAVIMFWVGVVYRINEYGLTISRFYLVLSGLLMVLVLAVFLRKGKGRYFDVTLIGIVAFLIFTYIPPISADTVASKSQYTRVVKNAEALGLLGDDGKFVAKTLDYADMDEVSLGRFKTIYDALYYLDQERAGQLGLGSWHEFREMYKYNPYDIHREYESIYLYLDRAEGIDIAGFSIMYSLDSYISDKAKYYNDSSTGIQVKEKTSREDGSGGFKYDDFLKISNKELLSEQLQKIGLEPNDSLSLALLKEHTMEMLTIVREDFMVLLSSMRLELIDDEWKISYIAVDKMFLK